MREPNPYSSLEARIIRIPRDDGDPDVSGQLEEILRGCNCPAEMLAKNNTIVTTIRTRIHVIKASLLSLKYILSGFSVNPHLFIAG